MIEIKERSTAEGMDVVYTGDLSPESLKELINWCDQHKVPIDFMKIRKDVEGKTDCYYVHLYGEYSLNRHNRAESKVKKIEREWGNNG